MIVLIVIVVLIVAAGAFVWLTYNRLVALRLACENSWSQIDVALKLRHDLIPKLVSAVSGYAEHERETLSQVTELRTEAVGADEAGPAERGTAEARFGGGIGRMLAVAEDYPQLRATENFQRLQTELSSVEEKISITRRVYNDTVQTYNTKIQVFPSNLVADGFRFQRREFFEAGAGSQIAPTVCIGAAGGRDVSIGSLIWKVLWRLAVVAIVLGVLAGPPHAVDPERGHEQGLRHHRGEHPRGAAARLEPAGHREPRLRLPRRHVHRRLPRHPAQRGGADQPTSRSRRAAGTTARAATPHSGPPTGPDSFGVEQHPQFERIVWHYAPTDAATTYRLSYDVTDAVTAYADVLDVGWTVWGDQWKFWLDDLSAPDHDARRNRPDRGLGLEPSAQSALRRRDPRARRRPRDRRRASVLLRPAGGGGTRTSSSGRWCPARDAQLAAARGPASGNGADKVDAQEQRSRRHERLDERAERGLRPRWRSSGSGPLLVVGLSLLLALPPASARPPSPGT